MKFMIQQTPLTEATKELIYQGFSEHALTQTGMDGKGDALSFIAYDGEAFLGAVVVEIFWGQLHIKYVFVEEKYRGQGIGQRLINHALEFGKQQGCDFAFVETMSFQGPKFYRKMGFEIEFTRSGYSQETSFLYLSKHLNILEQPKVLNIRSLAISDIPLIVSGFAAHQWPKPASLFENYLREQKTRERFIWVAFVGEEFSGYVTLKWNSSYKPFADKNIPEIKDLNVLPPYRQKGIATVLLDLAEKIAAEKSDTVGIGVGLYEDYGSAQKLYVKRGYVPDGQGITYNDQPIIPGSSVLLDDDLILWFTKKLN